MKKNPKILMSGGGTGGHIFPAIAIAKEIKTRLPHAEFLFVGAENKMEMQKVPNEGFKIVGIRISGINRSKPLSNIGFPLKLVKALLASKKIIKEFEPDIAIGTGGFASGPPLWMAAKASKPIVLQEQNAFPGITNRFLAKKAKLICTAYPNVPKFPSAKTRVTGNPVRTDLFQDIPESKLAKEKFGLDPKKPTILSLGGSLGSRTLNNAWLTDYKQVTDADAQLLWQTGSLSYNNIKANKDINKLSAVKVVEFISEMKWAFAAADIIVSRAGAMAISELSILGKPTILVPFPFAAEDHQTKNAQALVAKQAAIMVTDEQAPTQLVKTAIKLLQNKEQQKQLSDNLKANGKPEATKTIVDLVMNIYND